MVIDHVRRCLDLDVDVSPVYGSDRNQRHHRGLIRKRVGVVYDPKKAREVAAAAIREAAAVKNNPPDLINVALEMLVAQSLELLGFTVLDRMATTIRAQVNREIIAGIYGRISAGERAGLLATLQVRGEDGQSMFTRMKKPARRPSWSRFKEQSQYLAAVDGLGDACRWVEGVAESKIADFAVEAAAQDAASLGDYDPIKQIVLLACLVYTAQARARDDLAEMLCKRVAVITGKAKTELDEIRLRQRAVAERLIGGYKTVLEQLTPEGAVTATEQAALRLAHEALVTAASDASALGPASRQVEAVVGLVRALKVHS